MIAGPAYAASSLYAFEALRAGVRIFRYQPGFLLQKALLIDHDVSMLGSATLSPSVMQASDSEISLGSLPEIVASQTATSIFEVLQLSF